jgi:hypothetical protein
MSNPAYFTTGASVQVKEYNTVKYESLSVYQIKNVKPCWLYYRCISTSKTYTTWLNMNHCQYIKYKMSNPADCTTGASVQVKNIQHG